LSEIAIIPRRVRVMVEYLQWQYQLLETMSKQD
jgi:hypothetical protein